MAIVNHPQFLLYIEPLASERSEIPNDDGLTEIMIKAFNKAKSGASNYGHIARGQSQTPSFSEGSGFRGIHRTDYGEQSTNKDYQLENGMITNSLCIEYLRWYRDAIPQSELNKVHSLI